MYKRISLILVGGLAASSIAVAAPEKYALDTTHTFPSFEINHLGYSIQRGRFNTTNGSIVLDRAAGTAAVDISIDAASIDTGFEKLEAHLRNADFFDTDKHPTITFKSNKAQFKGDALVALDGDLTIKGVTKPVKLVVSNFKCGEHPRLKKPVCGAEATGTIKRSDFGVTYGVPAVGDEVKLMIQVEAFKE